MPLDWMPGRRLHAFGSTEALRLMWRGMSWRSRVHLLGAIGLTFGVMGFVIDLMNLDNRLPWAEVLAYAASTSLLTAFMMLAIIRNRAYTFFVAPALAVFFVVTRRWFAGMSEALPAGTTAAQWMVQRAARDGFACLALTMAGYALFIRFITSQGVQSVRMRTEMLLARDIHDSLVPPLTCRKGPVEVYGRAVPSTEVGGDLVDLVPIRYGALALIADVSGHGVAAGTLMAMVRAAVRTRVAGSGDDGARLCDVFATVNRVLIDLGRPDRFVTMAALLLRDDGSGEIALAGHLPVLRIRDGALERFENEHLPLGVRDGGTFAARPVTARAGDLFVLYTDGMTEIADASGRQLGAEPLEAVLLARPEAPLAELHDALMERVKAHGRPVEDMTLLLVRFAAAEDGSPTPGMTTTT
jgi:serine phosphatase RsbU (regulator of sigma subunit)